MDGLRRDHLFFLLAFWFVVHAFLFYNFGIRDNFVDSLRYLEMADHLLVHGQLMGGYTFFYLVPIALLAFFRLLFSDGVLVFILFQCVISALGTLALYRSAAALFRNATAGLYAASIHLLWIDCLQWNTAVMTESLAASMTCFVLYLLTHYKASTKVFVLLFLFVVLSVMTRPTGVLTGVGVVTFLLSRYWQPLRERPVLKGALLGTLGAVIISVAYFMLNEWDFTDQYVRGNIVTYMDTIEGKAHYNDELRLDTSSLTMPDEDKRPFEKIVMFVLENPLHFAKAAVLKIFYLVTSIRPYFSTFHNLYTVVWLAFIYALFYAGVRQAPDTPVRNFSLAIVFANCILVGISAVDWDNRFYMPMEPVIAFLAGGGAWHMRKRLVSKS